MNQKGFSLVEILMAAGIVGGIALTVAKLSQDSARVTKTTEANNEINNFMSDVSYILSDKASCEATVAGSETIGAQISTIKKVKDSTIFNVYELDPKKYGNNSFSISSIRTSLEDGGVLLLFDIKRANVTTLGSRQITKRLPLKAVVENGKIKSCFSDTESMIESAVRAACKGNSARFDENLKECHHELQILICESGKVMQQIVAEDGTIKSECVPIIPTPMNCPAGEFIKSITVDGATTCEPLNTKNGPCGVGQYAYQLSGGELRCRDIPKCSGNRSLLTSDATTGELKCSPLLCDPTNQYFAGFNSTGAAVCKNFPDKSCGQGQYISEVKPDGSIVCGEVPNHVSLPQSDYAFVDGFDKTTNTWSRKSFTQTAQKMCESFVGSSWTGTKCNVNIPTQITAEDVCNTIEGGEWISPQKKCVIKPKNSLRNCYMKPWMNDGIPTIKIGSSGMNFCRANERAIAGSCEQYCATADCESENFAVVLQERGTSIGYPYGPHPNGWCIEEGCGNVIGYGPDSGIDLPHGALPLGHGWYCKFSKSTRFAIHVTCCEVE